MAKEVRQLLDPCSTRTDYRCWITEAEPAPETVAQLAQEVYANDLLQLLVVNMWRFEFEVGCFNDTNSLSGLTPPLIVAEGRCPNIHTSAATADRKPLANCRVPNNPRRGHFRGHERVRLRSEDVIDAF